MGNGNNFLNNFFKKNKFIGSFNSYKDISPTHSFPEYCFVGRSNVGKSSIINAITKTKNIAKTSKTPGRTQSINVFEINNIINIVDLPGYGFAKLSKIVRKNLQILTHEYIENRKNIINVFVLIDTKVGIKNLDIDMFDLLAVSERSFSIVLTKIDKCSKSHVKLQEKSILSIMNNYPTTFKKIFLTTIKNNEGMINIQKEICKLSEIK